VEEEDGRPVYPLKGVPVEKLDKYQKEIFKKCKLIRPAYMPIIGKETYQDKHFIMV
jgi:ATP-dependent DNA helicase RecG